MGIQKVYRSRSDRYIAGVCGGLGEYIDMDSTILRLGWVMVTIFSGVLPGVLIYCIAMFIIPKKPMVENGLQHTVIEVSGYSGKK
ncbi:MAG: PspC domain-containing protein [Candidatus Paceibacterota bacterium]